MIPTVHFLEQKFFTEAGIDDIFFHEKCSKGKHEKLINWREGNQQ